MNAEVKELTRGAQGSIPKLVHLFQSNDEMKHAMVICVLFAVAMSSCTTDYVCVCEVEAEGTTLEEATHYPGLRKSEAELVEEDCEDRSICTWKEDK